MSLSPTHTTSASSDGWLVGRLLGDLASFTQYEDFDNKKLTVPSQPRSNPRVQAGISNWMLVDDLRFELDGTVCNKIGVSFNAFQMESGACQNVAGSCLNNQLENLYQADLEKSQRGLVGEYLIGNYGEFSLFTSSVSNDRYLALKVEQIQNSIVTLTFPADDIVFVSTRCALFLLGTLPLRFLSWNTGVLAEFKRLKWNHSKREVRMVLSPPPCLTQVPWWLIMRSVSLF